MTKNDFLSRHRVWYQYCINKITSTLSIVAIYSSKGRDTMHEIPSNQEVLNVTNFMTILIVMAIVFFLAVNPFNTGSSSPICVSQVFAYLFWACGLLSVFIYLRVSTRGVTWLHLPVIRLGRDFTLIISPNLRTYPDRQCRVWPGCTSVTIGDHQSN